MPALPIPTRVVEDLVLDYIARRRRGECPSVDDYITRRPEFLAFARDLIPTLEALQFLRARFRPH